MASGISEEMRRRILRDPLLLAAFGFGTGFAPKSPGTVGSLPGVVLAAATMPFPLSARLVFGAALAVVGVWLCGRAARRIGVHDHPGIVWDEIVAVYLLLQVATPPSIGLWALAFGLFRLFDILKPWPIRDLDHRLGGGLGIMLDDLAAALYAASLLAFGWWLMT